MELSWPMKIRVALGLLTGVFVLGFLPFKLICPAQGGIFSLISGNITVYEIILCAGLAFAAGFLASAVCTPYGRIIGITAAPAGMSVWGLKSGSLSSVFQQHPLSQYRLDIYKSLQFETIIWFGIAVCGYLGAILAEKIFCRSNVRLPDFQPLLKIKLPNYGLMALGVVASVFVAAFVINILAVNVGYPDAKLGAVISQPANIQIALAVFLGFGAAGYLFKLLFGGKYYFPAIATAVITYYFTVVYIKSGVIGHLASSWPAVFFAKGITAVLPVQMVGFGILGSIWGYWMAVRHHIWKTQQI